MSDINKITKYIVDNDVDTIAKSVIANGRDPWSVMQQTKDARVAFQIKTQQLQDELAKHLPKWNVGMILEAQEDCLNNFRKGQKVDITEITDTGAFLDGIADIEDKWIRRYFKIIESR
jgi:F0F1-type ATP synthase alpha subunit